MLIEKYCDVCKNSIHCCIFKNGGFVFVTPKNAKAIKKKINKDYSYFLEYSPFDRNIVEVLRTCDPSAEGGMRYLQLNKENRLLRLKTQKTGRCIFLKDSGRCKIYDVRPNVCRIFPFWVMRLLDNRIKIIEHGLDNKCGVLRSIAKPKVEIEDVLSKKDKLSLIKLFKAIEKEKNYVGTTKDQDKIRIR
jgi:Fe-S-cluster containining protein